MSWMADLLAKGMQRGHFVGTAVARSSSAVAEGVGVGVADGGAGGLWGSVAVGGGVVVGQGDDAGVGLVADGGGRIVRIASGRGPVSVGVRASPRARPRVKDMAMIARADFAFMVLSKCARPAGLSSVVGVFHFQQAGLFGWCEVAASPTSGHGSPLVVGVADLDGVGPVAPEQEGIVLAESDPPGQFHCASV